MEMSDLTVYVKCERKVECTEDEVLLEEVAEIYCSQKQLQEKLNHLVVFHFGRGRQGVISTIDLAKSIGGVNEDCTPVFLGEQDVYLERVTKTSEKAWVKYLKILFVALISFFGTAFTIMAYHNDIGINGVFENMYMICTGVRPKGINLLQITYSAGLAIGIVLFFNHVGGKKITGDPTPIEVAMNNYAKDVDMTVIEKMKRDE